MRRALVLVLLLLPAVAHAGSGGFVPPMRIDVGPAVSGTAGDPAMQVVAGIHWASVYPKPKAGIDVGIGIVSTSHPGRDTEPAGVARTSAPAASPLELFGGYVEVATRTAGSSWWRTWVGTRVESGRASLDSTNHGFIGIATRISTEAFVGGASSDSRSVFVGVFAVGFYGEISARRIVGLGSDLGASVGLTFRLPLIAVD